MNYEDVLEHYRKEEVKKEIFEYCRNRWVALEGSLHEERLFIRYWRDGTPLKFEKENDIDRAFKTFRGVRPRTVYATINLYRTLQRPSDTDKPENIVRCSPIWDIDSSPDKWKHTIEAVRIICDFLEREGVSKSIFIKWSGRGAHIHLHEMAFSEDIISKHNPLDIAFSVVEYTLKKLEKPLLEVVNASEGVIKVENKVDIKRVFTAPLSLHREVDLCCVCFKSSELDNFEISWADPKSYKHNPKWRDYVVGEADPLALKAIEEVGGYKGWTREMPREKAMKIEIIKKKPSTKPITGKIGRFQVMGLLQAARYYVLTKDLEKAKSFGLNRAIFYAWAKHYGRGVRTQIKAKSLRRTLSEKAGGKLTKACGEEAFVSPRGWFMMGDAEQLPHDYDRQIVRHISSVVPYEEAWKAALEYVSSFPKRILEDPQRFFKVVYEPVRDSFVEDVIKGKKRKPPSTLDSLIL